MASAFSHAVVAMAVCRVSAEQSLPARFWLLSIACSILPDADVIGFWAGIEYSHVLGHRGLSHSLSFALVLSLVIVQLWFGSVTRGSRGWWLLIAHFFLVAASHGVLDAMTDGGLGVAFFAPFDNTRYFFAWRPVEVSPIGVTEFFNQAALKILLSEFLWIWIPAGLLVMGVNVWRKRCPM
jgi:inner membrane protein